LELGGCGVRYVGSGGECIGDVVEADSGRDERGNVRTARREEVDGFVVVRRAARMQMMVRSSRTMRLGSRPVGSGATPRRASCPPGAR
jgi:hypothetical protein